MADETAHLLASAASLKRWYRENSPSRSSSMLMVFENLHVKKRASRA
jgi:hypothetical protein